MLNQDSGAIALVGSGEYSVQMQELESQLLRLAISRGKKNHFIQIPTASSHEGHRAANIGNLWGKNNQIASEATAFTYLSMNVKMHLTLTT